MIMALKVGFSSLDITPPLGCEVVGYFIERRAENILDPLRVIATAFELDGEKALILSFDALDVKDPLADAMREEIAEALGLSPEAILISATHTHTGPRLDLNRPEGLEADYVANVRRTVVSVSTLAFLDLAPASVSLGEGKAERISFGRRFRMKDGSVATNPGVNNPDIVAPIGEIDERVNLIRIDREGKDTVAIVNFGTHPDVVGGSVISADWPGFVRTCVERSLPGVRCLFLNGAQGDVNHVNVSPRPGEEKGLHKDFDDVDRGYDHARHMGKVIAGAVLSCFDKTRDVTVDSISYLVRPVSVPANTPDPSEIPLAEKYDALHRAGRDEEIPFRGMALTTAVATAGRILRLKDGPSSFSIPMSVLKLGGIAFVGIAGEPFTGIGMGLKAGLPECDMVLPLCLTNGSRGYFPMQDSYAEGGYEAGSSPFRAGTAELLTEEGIKLVRSL